MWYGSKLFIFALVAGMLTSCSCSSDSNIYDDDENNYRGKEKDDYETGYCEGYEAGYDDNYEYADG